MKLKRGLFFITILLIMLSGFTSLAQDGDDEGGTCDLVYLFDGWARSTMPGAPNGAVFGLLVNLSSEEDTLIGASTQAAEAVELHETVVGDGDVMQMRPVEVGFVIPSQGYVELMRGGLHIMLINLTDPLQAGDTVALLLEFEHAGEVAVEVPVRDMMAAHGEETHEEAMEAIPLPEREMPEISIWDEACQGVHFVNSWARAAMPGMNTSAAYVLLVNLTTDDEVLVSASTEAAEVVELHEMIMDDDVMRMRPLQAGIIIPAGEVALLKPGGLHIMLINLTTTLDADDTIEMILNFAVSGDTEAVVPVRAPEDAMQQMGDNH